MLKIKLKPKLTLGASSDSTQSYPDQTASWSPGNKV